MSCLIHESLKIVLVSRILQHTLRDELPATVPHFLVCLTHNMQDDVVVRGIGIVVVTVPVRRLEVYLYITRYLDGLLTVRITQPETYVGKVRSCVAIMLTYMQYLYRPAVGSALAVGEE